MTPSAADPSRGLLDTNILILRRGIDPAYLPDYLAISTITLAELSAGVHLIDGDDQDARTERARRADLLQRTEYEFDPLPFDAEAARFFGRMSAAVRARGRTPRRRLADLMIASVAAASGLPLYTTNPDDFTGTEELLDIRPVPRPS